MDKAINFLRRELTDLERLMQAIENAMERKIAATTPRSEVDNRSKTSVLGNAPAISVWTD